MRCGLGGREGWRRELGECPANTNEEEKGRKKRKGKMQGKKSRK